MMNDVAVLAFPLLDSAVEARMLPLTTVATSQAAEGVVM